MRAVKSSLPKNKESVDSAPISKSHSVRSSFLRMGYSLTKDSTIDDYAREARCHPGFELQDKE